MTDSPDAGLNKERNGNMAIDKRVRRHVTGRIREYFAITAPGFEALCRKELRDLGLDCSGVSVDCGGVAFAGRFVNCLQANLHLRTATRILMRIDTFTATNVRQLERKAGEIPWELFLPAGIRPEIKVRSRRSRLYHTDVVARGLQNGIARRFGGSTDSAFPHIPQTLFARALEDRYSLSLDSSGAPLYKRGLKSGPARAPIRETLAAAILMAAGYDSERPLVDPLCGSGTFSLEAAMMTKRMAPGMKRPFAFMDWPAFRDGQWAFLKRDATSRVREINPPRIFASDVDTDACRRLADTVTGNGLSDSVRVEQKDVFQCVPDHYGGGPGLVVINPPYGIRIGSARAADDLFDGLCMHVANRFHGWTVALIAPKQARIRELPFPARRLPLFHGGLKLTLLIGVVP